MGLLSRLFGTKTKPFHLNKDASERRAWFSQTEPWSNLNPAVVDALVEKFGEDPMFEAFVVGSMDANVVDQYARIADPETLSQPKIICARVSAIVARRGAESVAAMGSIVQDSNPGRHEKQLAYNYGVVRNCLESAIILDENQIAAYLGLASALALIGKQQDALGFAQEGLARVKELRAREISIDESTTVGSQLQETEQALAELARSLS